MKHETESDPASAGAAPVPPASGTATEPVNDLPQDLAAAYRKLLAEKRDLYDRLLRKQAELENVKKRTEREKEEFLKHATADLIRALLPAIDSFERAMKHRDKRVPEDFYKGVELIHREFVEVLQRAGLEPIETRNALFDPHLHQAVERVESTTHRDQEIVEELQRGYKLKNRLLRPAIVKVAVPPQPEPENQQSRKSQA
jgi:molecular chaperone GrpE